IDHHRAALGFLLADDEAKDRRLARAVGPAQADALALEQAHRGVEKQDLLAVLLADRLEANHVTTPRRTRRARVRAGRCWAPPRRCRARTGGNAPRRRR